MSRRTTATDNALDYYRAKSYNRDLWFQVADRDYQILIDYLRQNKALDIRDKSLSEPPLTVLDLGCGTGKYPEMLADLYPDLPPIRYDLLDPSPYSLDQAEKALSSPLTAGKRFPNITEDVCSRGFFDNAGPYDVIWAMHSFYYIDLSVAEELLTVLQGNLRDERARFYIYLATKSSSYYSLGKFSRIFNPANPEKTYTMSDDIVSCLERAGIDYKSRNFTFDHVVPAEKERVLENYLGQCALNPGLVLSDWASLPETRQWLEAHFHDDHYAFPQEVSLFEISGI